MDSITVKRLRSKAVFKIIFLGLIIFFVPFFTICGFLASAGLLTMSWDGQSLTGISAIISGPFMGLLMALIFGLFISSCTALGLILFARVRPIKIEYYPKDSEQNS